MIFFLPWGTYFMNLRLCCIHLFKVLILKCMRPIIYWLGAKLVLVKMCYMFDICPSHCSIKYLYLYWNLVLNLCYMSMLLFPRVICMYLVVIIFVPGMVQASFLMVAKRNYSCLSYVWPLQTFVAQERPNLIIRFMWYKYLVTWSMYAIHNIYVEWNNVFWVAMVV